LVVLQVDWESMWREQLSEYSRSAAGIGWTTKITMEVCATHGVYMCGLCQVAAVAAVLAHLIALSG
jgi:hypothetical protein